MRIVGKRRGREVAQGRDRSKVGRGRENKGINDQVRVESEHTRQGEGKREGETESEERGERVREEERSKKEGRTERARERRERERERNKQRKKEGERRRERERKREGEKRGEACQSSSRQGCVRAECLALHLRLDST